MKELREWAAFERLSPFPVARSDIQAAVVAQTTAAVWGSPPKLSTFIPDYEGAALSADGVAAAKRRDQELLSGIHRQDVDPG